MRRGASGKMSLVHSTVAGILVAWVSWSSWVIGDLVAQGGGGAAVVLLPAYWGHLVGCRVGPGGVGSHAV